MEVESEVIVALLGLFGVLLAAGLAATGWIVSLLWRTTNQLARMEETSADHERRLSAVEAKPAGP